MAQFWTPSGLAAIAQTESSGNPTAVNPASGASGLYGFLNSTWASMAPQAGVDTSQYPTAASAPAAVQSSVAAITPISNWTCPGCNSLAASIAATPGNTTATPGNFTNFTTPSGVPDQFSVSTTPGSQDQMLIQDGQTLDGTTPSSDSGASFEFSPNQPVEASQGIPVAQNAANYANFGLQPVGNADPLAAQTTGTDYGAFGLSPLDSSLGNTLFGGALPNAVTGGGTAGTGTVTAGGSDFFTNLLNDIWTLTQRGGLIILGVVLVGVGGYWLAAHSETKIKLVH